LSYYDDIRKPGFHKGGGCYVFRANKIMLILERGLQADKNLIMKDKKLRTEVRAPRFFTTTTTLKHFLRHDQGEIEVVV
jgi:hypothetical protein